MKRSDAIEAFRQSDHDGECGLRHCLGCWKIMLIPTPRISFQLRSPIPTNSLPAKRIDPEVTRPPHASTTPIKAGHVSILMILRQARTDPAPVEGRRHSLVRLRRN